MTAPKHDSCNISKTAFRCDIPGRFSPALLLARCLKVMIFDFDVHHGNGTHDVFYGDPDVLFVSSHQSGSYPGTGRSRAFIIPAHLVDSSWLTNCQPAPQIYLPHVIFMQ